MISSSRILLREWSETDLNFLMDLRNNVELQAKLLANARGSNLLQVRAWLKSRLTNNQQSFFVIELKNIQPIGYIQTDLVEGSLKTFEVGICIIDSFQGVGIGQEAMKLIEEFLFVQGNAEKILLHVDVNNQPAINCYRKLSFKQISVLSRHKKIGDAWCDVAIMEKNRPAST